MRPALAVALCLAGCNDPTQVLVTVELEAGLAAPQFLQASAYDPLGALFRERRLGSAALPDVLSIRVADEDQLIRIVISGGPEPIVGSGSVRTVPYTTSRMQVTLARVVADRDGDGVPDAVDLCPDVADPDQADRDRDGRGDACDPEGPPPDFGPPDGGSPPPDLAGVSLCSVVSVSTFSGSSPGYREGVASSAQFRSPSGVSVLFGSTLVVTDSDNGRVRGVDFTGATSLIAGATEGFDRPRHLAANGAGTIYFADQGNHQIRSISGGQVTLVAGNGAAGDNDGTGAGAGFWEPHGVALDGTGHLYVSDRHARIRRVTVASGRVETLSGSTIQGFTDGSAATALWREPAGMVVLGGALYVTDKGNHRVRKLDLSTLMVSTVAGTGTAGSDNGPGASAQFNRPRGITAGPGGYLYVAEESGLRVRRIAPDGTTDLVAGSGANGTASGSGCGASFGNLDQIAYWAGALYVADYFNDVLRKITLP
jgi:hypothetical protein